MPETRASAGGRKGPCPHGSLAASGSMPRGVADGSEGLTRGLDATGCRSTSELLRESGRDFPWGAEEQPATELATLPTRESAQRSGGKIHPKVARRSSGISVSEELGTVSSEPTIAVSVGLATVSTLSTGESQGWHDIGRTACLGLDCQPHYSITEPLSSNTS